MRRRRCGCSRGPTVSPATIRALYAAARATGADVPVCLDPRPRMMRGIGEMLSAPLALPPLPAVLVNPGVALATKEVFAGWKPAAIAQPSPIDSRRLAKLDEPRGSFCNSCERRRTIWKPPAIALAPVIAEVLRRCARCPAASWPACRARARPVLRCLPQPAAAIAAAKTLRGKYPHWWVRATALLSDRVANHAQCVRAMQKSTVSASAVFIGESGNSASASRAMAP